MVPVVCGTSYKNKGVQKLLDAIIDYMPSPLDVPAIKGINPDTDEEVERPSSDEEPFSALAFKIATDPFVGKLAFFRVYSGIVNQGDTVLNATKDNRERFGRIVQMHANHRKDLTTVYAGDIAAAVGLKNTTTGDTLCDEKHPVILESMEFPEPVIQLAIEPKTKAGQEKMGIALAKLAEEDPTFKTWTDEETGQTIIAGMGELHLDIIVDRLLREFKVEANVGAPQVAYKETIKGNADIDYKYKKQSGGSVSTVTLRSVLLPTNQVRAMSSRTPLSAVQFPRSTSLLLTQVSRVLQRQVSSQATKLLTLRLNSTTDPTTRLTPLKWHSRSQVLSPSRKLSSRLHLSSWSLS